MDYIYTQLDENSICVGLSQLAGEVTNSIMVRITEYDIGLLGKKYENDEWSEVV